MRTAARRDGNEPEVIEAFQVERCLVWKLNQADRPDLLVFDPTGRLRLVEVKNPDGRNSISASQLDAFAGWPIEIVRSAAEARALCHMWVLLDEPGTKVHDG